MENDFSGSGGDETLKSRRSPSCEEGAATTESISLKDAAAPSTVVSDSSKSPGKITVSFKDVTFNSDFDSGMRVVEMNSFICGCIFNTVLSAGIISSISSTVVNIE